MTSCLIEAGVILVRILDGIPDLRYDAAMRIDKGMIVQIGTMEAVSDGNNHLPRYGSGAHVALPSSFGSSAENVLAPGRDGDLVLVEAASLHGAFRAGASLFLGGRLVVDRGRIAIDDGTLTARLDAWLKAPETPQETAAARLVAARI